MANIHTRVCLCVYVYINIIIIITDTCEQYKSSLFVLDRNTVIFMLYLLLLFRY